MSAGEPPADPAAISGRLSETPLFAVFRRIQQQGLSGTLSVIRGDQVRQLVFDNGELHAARSSLEEHRIGATLVRWGYISETDLEDALEEQKRTHQRIDRILVEKGLVTRVVVDSEARRQMEQIVFSTLSWPDGAYHFEANTGPLELDVSAALSQEMIIEGIRRIPESEQFLSLLGDLSGVPTLTRDPMSSGSLRLLRDAVGLISRIDGSVNLRDLLAASASAGTASAKILYSLMFAGIIEIHPVGSLPLKPERRVGGRRATDLGRSTFALELSQYKPTLGSGPTDVTETGFAALQFHGPDPNAPPPPKAFTVPLTPREIVLQTHRQLDWLSHYDLLGVSRKATQGEIEEAYRARSLLFDPSLKAHPELVDCWRQLTVLTKWLRVAYRMLSNPETREAYDRKIEGSTPPDPSGKPGE